MTTKTSTATPDADNAEVHPASAAQMLEIQRLDTETLLVPIIGTSPLITHNWSSKAKRIMLEAQQGVRKQKENRDPQAEYEASLYRTKDGFGIPALAFKSATCNASRFYDKKVSKIGLRQMLFFKGVISDADPQPLFPLVGEPRMREDMVTVGISGTDLRYRAEFPDWSTLLTVVYVRSCISRDSVLSIIDAAGLGVGVSEWRPERGGDFGTYRIDPTRNVEVLG